MLCVIGIYSGDIEQSKTLLRWIQHLGGCKGHDCLIVADAALGYDKALDCKKLAMESFDKVQLICTAKSVVGWPKGANALFIKAADYVARWVKAPWIWLEPDAIPLKMGWLDAIEKAYAECGRPFMGHIYECTQPNLPKQLMSAIAVYPGNAITMLPLSADTNTAFDVASAPVMTAKGAHTPLIHHLWGMPDNPPTFREQNIPGTNVFCLSQIPKEAVIWHRCKDESLITLLKGEPLVQNKEFVVVFPFCKKDLELARKNLKWQADIAPEQKYDAVLVYEEGAVDEYDECFFSALEAYRNVTFLKIPVAPNPSWPQGPNHAFVNAAKHMQSIGRPWLWMEPDMVPLRSDWLAKLQMEYKRAGRPFMGHIVNIMGHLQGTAVYPADLPTRCPKMMDSGGVAFDAVIRNNPFTHKANHLFAHGWGMHQGKPHDYLGKDSPIIFRTVNDVHAWVPKQAVTYHRSKDGSLIDRLREMHKVPVNA